MKKKELKEKIRKIVSEQLAVSFPKIKLKSNLKDDLGCDSMDIVELTIVIEEEFNIEIPDEIAGRFKKVKDLVNAVKILTQPSI